jgi:hypothetical protein
MKQTDRVRAAANASDQNVRKAALRVKYLSAGLAADHRLKISDHQRVWMRSQSRAEQVIRRFYVRHPVTKRLVYSVFQGARTRIDRTHLSAQEPHAKDVQLLPPHVFSAHIDDAFQTKECANGGSRDAVLARTGFGDDPFFAHSPCKQDLPETIIYLVGAGVIKIFAF